MKKLRQRSAWLVVPALVMTLLLLAYPLAVLLISSVTEPEAGLANYEQFATQGIYLRVMINTFLIALAVTLICLVAGFPLAYRIVTLPERWQKIISMIVMLPMWTSVLVRTYAWFVLLGPAGAISKFMISAGLTSGPLQIVPSRAGVLIGMVAVMLPMMVLTLTATMKSINWTLLAAAQSMGAGSFQRQRHVFIPLCSPGIMAGCIQIFLLTLAFYVVPALLGAPRDQMISQLIVFQINNVLNWGFASAMTIVLLVTTFLIYWLYSRLLQRRTDR